MEDRAMPEQTAFKVLSVRNLPSPDRERLGRTDRVIAFEVEGAGRDVVRLPAEDFTEDKLREAIKALMAERSQWEGKTFRL